MRRTRRWQPNHCSAHSTEGDNEHNRRGRRPRQRPKQKHKQARHKRDRTVHIQLAPMVAQPRRPQPPNRATRIHDA